MTLLGYGKLIDSWHRPRCVRGMTTIGQMTLFGFADETAVRSNVVPTRKVWHRNARSLKSTTPIAEAREQEMIARKNDCRWRERAVPDFAHAGEIETPLTFTQAARMLGITQRAFRRMADRGTIRVVRVSDWSPRVRPRELQRFAGEAISGHSDGFATFKPSDDRKSGFATRLIASQAPTPTGPCHEPSSTTNR